jgi:uroporphyrinogen-III decarboxylase
MPGVSDTAGRTWTSRERVAAAMRHTASDRVPVMCQLALGHYFLNASLDPVDVWHDSEAFATALVRLQQHYRFDGVLVNLPGREPHWRTLVDRVETVGRDRHVVWSDGLVTICPPDDNPHVFPPDRRTRPVFRLDDLADAPSYVEPHARLGPALLEPPFPPWHWDTLRRVREMAPDVSVHGEVFSPFSQLCEAIGPEDALVALRADAARVEAALAARCEATVELMAGLVAAGADAVLVSSAYAGAGLISARHYRAFVLPFEARVIAGLKARCPGTPVYTHTCGAIGDRLELLAETGTDGIDTLDPPPLGDVRLADAKARVGARLFLKGNLDPVGVVLLGTPEAVSAEAARCLDAAAAGGGYILSTACSVPPHAPHANVAVLREVVESAGVTR